METFWDRLADLTAACRRSYPRVHDNVPVRLANREGASVEVTTNDLSTGGLQFACDRDTASRLRLQDGEGSGTGAVYTIDLVLRVASRSLRVNGQARVVYMTAVPDARREEAVAVGMQFLDLGRGGDEALMRFIEHHMRPAEI